MKRILIIAVLFIFTIGFSGCEKIADDTPSAIKKLIKKYSKSWCVASVIEYECNEQKIYLFEHDDIKCGREDASSYICDKDGNELCTIGGFDGVDGCKKEYGNRVKIRDIWTSKN
jgi:hypothetical protein